MKRYGKKLAGRLLTAILLMGLFLVTAIPALAVKDWKSHTELPEIEGDYKLTRSVALNSPWTVPRGTTTIDLNGFEVSIRAADDASISITNGQTLKIKDTSTSQNGSIETYSEYCGVQIRNRARFIMESGTLRGMIPIIGVEVDSDGFFTMKGGSITDYLNGVIAGGTFTMEGGSITGNTKYGVDVIGIFFNISGNSVIKNNTKANVYLRHGRYITVTRELSCANGSIGVTMETAPTADNDIVFTNTRSKYTDMNDAGKFFSDNSSYYVKKNTDNQLTLSASPPRPTVKWTAPSEDTLIVMAASDLPKTGDESRIALWLLLLIGSLVLGCRIQRRVDWKQ